MGPVECPREQDVLDALASGRWPARCPDDLRNHVAGCAICADLIEVAGPLMEAANVEWESVRVPAPGTVWWRAQLRARREAARQASRPVTIAQGFGWGLAAVLLIGLAWVGAPVMADLFAMLPPMPGLPSSLSGLSMPAVPESIDLPDLGRWRLLAAAAIGWLVVASLVLYVALLEE